MPNADGPVKERGGGRVIAGFQSWVRGVGGGVGGLKEGKFEKYIYPLKVQLHSGVPNKPRSRRHWVRIPTSKNKY